MSYTVTYQTSWVLHFEVNRVIHVTRGAMYRLRLSCHWQWKDEKLKNGTSKC